MLIELKLMTAAAAAVSGSSVEFVRGVAWSIITDRKDTGRSRVGEVKSVGFVYIGVL